MLALLKRFMLIKSLFFGLLGMGNLFAVFVVRARISDLTALTWIILQPVSEISNFVDAGGVLWMSFNLSAGFMGTFFSSFNCSGKKLANYFVEMFNIKASKNFYPTEIDFSTKWGKRQQKHTKTSKNRPRYIFFSKIFKKSSN